MRVERLREALDVEISVFSWNGFNLFGDEKSIMELQRLMIEVERFKVYRERMRKALLELAA